MRVQDRIAQSPELHRAVSGRGDGGGRHPARHFYDGRTADRSARLATVWTAGSSRGQAARNRRILEGVVGGDFALWQLLRRTYRGRRVHF